MRTLINIVIIEDDDVNFNYLKDIIDKIPHLSFLGNAKSKKESINLINSLRPDIIFLDIELVDCTGFEVLEGIDDYYYEVIFTTGYDNFYEKAVEHYAFQYLLKPIDQDKLIETINTFLKRIKQKEEFLKKNALISFLREKNSKLLLHTGESYVFVEISSILKCLAEGNFTLFFIKDEKPLLVSNNLKYYENLLTEKGFFRASRFCLVNTQHIKSIYKRETIILFNNDKIQVSVRNKSNLVELIEYLSK